MIMPELSPHGNKWLLVRDWDCMGFTVPAGFKTDLDSVPRLPLIHSWLKGRTKAAALLHDYLYSIRYERKLADDLFLEVMRLEGVKDRYALPIYWAVRLFGGSRYDV